MYKESEGEDYETNTMANCMGDYRIFTAVYVDHRRKYIFYTAIWKVFRNHRMS